MRRRRQWTGFRHNPDCPSPTLSAFRECYYQMHHKRNQNSIEDSTLKERMTPRLHLGLLSYDMPFGPKCMPLNWAREMVFRFIRGKGIRAHPRDLRTGERTNSPAFQNALVHHI